MYAFSRCFFFKVTCIAFKVYILTVHTFSGNQTHDLGVASAMLYCLSYMNDFVFIH